MFRRYPRPEVRVQSVGEYCSERMLAEVCHFTSAPPNAQFEIPPMAFPDLADGPHTPIDSASPSRPPLFGHFFQIWWR